MTNLEFGSSGEDVKRLQERLKEFGFYDGEISGEFDEETRESVKRFQDEEGLSPDGFVGLMTMHALDLLEHTPANQNIQGETNDA